MNMTHYMQLLADNQPWNILLFMVIPVVLAETLAITELHVLFTRNFTGSVRAVNRWAGLLAGLYFLGVFAHLTGTAVLPLTQTGGWRGWIDVTAVLFYLAGVVPLFAITLLEFGVLLHGAGEMAKMKLHAILVGAFLVVAHVAMVFGMLDPTLGGWTPDASAPAHGHGAPVSAAPGSAPGGHAGHGG